MQESYKKESTKFKAFHSPKKRTYKEKPSQISLIETERQNYDRIEKLSLFEKVAGSKMMLS